MDGARMLQLCRARASGSVERQTNLRGYGSLAARPTPVSAARQVEFDVGLNLRAPASNSTTATFLSSDFRFFPSFFSSKILISTPKTFNPEDPLRSPGNCAGQRGPGRPCLGVGHSRAFCAAPAISPTPLVRFPIRSFRTSPSIFGIASKWTSPPHHRAATPPNSKPLPAFEQQ